MEQSNAYKTVISAYFSGRGYFTTINQKLFGTDCFEDVVAVLPIFRELQWRTQMGYAPCGILQYLPAGDWVDVDDLVERCGYSLAFVGSVLEDAASRDWIELDLTGEKPRGCWKKRRNGGTAKMSECTHNCSTCSSGCGSSEFHRDESLMEKLMPGASVKKVIAVVSGKGGVGKSMVTSLLAAETQRRGFRTAILDADLTGPSIPKAFGVSERMRAAADHMLPVTTPSGIQMVSMNLLLDAPEEPVLWRGPVIAGVVAQFWSEVMWDDVDYMFIDLPPGTGDVPLTVMQGLPLDGIVIVSSPQDLVGMIVEKAVKMARMMKVPMLSLVENMSYFICPDCGKVHEIFGESKVQKLAAIYGIDAFIRLPINPDSARLVDEGRVEDIDCDYVAALADTVLR